MHRTPWELNASNNRPFFIQFSMFYCYYSKYFCKKQDGKKFVSFKIDFFLPLKANKANILSK